MLAFVPAIFLSAFLLFQVQPVIARYILPWYGGSPAVWTTCMLFFQIGLLAGYSYAHLLVSRFRNNPLRQIGVHLGLLILSSLLLPIIPSESLKPAGTGLGPAAGIVLLLFRTIGLPYIVISGTGPLLQNWFSEASSGKSPYRLYAVSNFGSLVALLSYPFIFEPNMKLGQQAWFWSGGYLVCAVLSGTCAWFFFKRSPDLPDLQNQEESAISAEDRSSAGNRVLCIAFAACGSVLLLSITNQTCQDVAVVPFLWVLPLSLYLLSFIISFDHARWYWRPFWIPLTVVAFGVLVYLLNRDYADIELHLTYQLAIYSLALFTGCMICHGEMVRLKPHPRHLTSFYLSVAFGGALGGIFVNLVAPCIFNGYWELHAVLLSIAGLTTLVLLHDLSASPHRVLIGAGSVLWVQSVLLLGFFLHAHIAETKSEAIVTIRGFYGILRVFESDAGTEDHHRSLNHGRICHGTQHLADDSRKDPGTYYGKDSAVGVLFNHSPARKKQEGMRIGVIGLGIGTIAAWAKPGDQVRFYEINSQVVDLAESLFTYLEDCEGEVSVAVGDARTVLERELEAGGIQRFNALFVDAFSGDSIPIHLLTREAFELYLKHLNEDGVIVVHITNMHLDLGNQVRSLASELGLATLQIEYAPDDGPERYSRWVLVSANKELLDSIRMGGWSTPWESDEPYGDPWTDDYCNLLEAIAWE